MVEQKRLSLAEQASAALCGPPAESWYGSTMAKRALWFFQRTAPGGIRRIPNRSMRRSLVGERGGRRDGGGVGRCVGMWLELHGKKRARVARVWFSKIRVCEDGRVDPHHRHETVKLAQGE